MQTSDLTLPYVLYLFFSKFSVFTNSLFLNIHDLITMQMCVWTFYFFVVLSQPTGRDFYQEMLSHTKHITLII